MCAPYDLGATKTRVTRWVMRGETMKNINMKLLLGGALLLTVAGAAYAKSKTAPVQVVPNVDLKQYAGKWYEIARFPNSFQKGCSGDVSANYTLRKDGKVDVENSCGTQNGKTKTAKGEARRISSKSKEGKLEVRFAPKILSFLPAVWGDYYILDLDKSYTTSIVGSSGRSYLWILSRTPQLDEETYQSLVEKARAQGFDVNKLVRTSQTSATKANDQKQ